MRPEMSLVFLTVFSGIGQGIFIILVAFDLITHFFGNSHSPFLYSAGIASIIFPLVGVAASFFHLGNPQKGYKALKMIRNSWLSREVFLLPAFLFIACWHLVLHYADVPEAYRLSVGSAGVAVSLGLYLSSAMLYAKIKYIREWANIYTVINFIILGIMSGLAVTFSLMLFTEEKMVSTPPLKLALIGIIVASLTTKWLSYRFNAKGYTSARIQNALGINDPNIRIMDTGTSYAHYNTSEYHYPLSSESGKKQQVLVLLTCFVVPAMLIGVSSTENGWSVVASMLASFMMIIGLLLERRLFFIHGNHIQNLYYANFRTRVIKNPLLRKSVKGYQL